MPAQLTQYRLPLAARHGSTEVWPPVLAAPVPEPVQLFELTVLALRRHAPAGEGGRCAQCTGEWPCQQVRLAFRLREAF